MKEFFTLIFIFISSISVAQNPIFIEPDKEDADSLHQIIATSSNDTLIMASCRHLALYYLDVNVDSSTYFSNRDIILARKLGLKIWEADGLDLNAIALSNSAEYSGALENFLEAIRIASNPATEQSIWNISTFTSTGNPEFARKSMLSTIYLDLGNLYADTDFFEESARSYNLSLALAKEVDDYTVPTIAYGGMSDILTALGDLDSAELLIKRALDYGDKAKYYKYRGADFNRYGLIERQRGENEKAKDKYNKGKWWSTTQKNLLGLSQTYLALGDLFLEEENLDSSIYYGYKSLLFQGLHTVKSLS